MGVIYHRAASRSSIEPSGQRGGLWVVSSLEEPKPHVHASTNGEIPRILIDSGTGLADPTVVDEFHSGACLSVLKDVVDSAIPLNKAASVLGEPWRCKSTASQCQPGKAKSRNERHVMRKKGSKDVYCPPEHSEAVHITLLYTTSKS